MAITKMRLINIVADVDKLDDVLTRFCTLDMFHPEPASKFVDQVKGSATFEDANPYEPLLQRLQEVSTDMNIDLTHHMSNKTDIDVDEIEKIIETKYNRFSLCKQAKQEVEQVIQEDKDAIQQMINLEDLGISLDEIFACKYLQVRFGRLPLDSVEKLKYYSGKPFIFKSFNTDSVYSWCVYLTTPKYAGEIDNIFSSLYFERIHIPSFVHGTPEKAKENMMIDIELNQQTLKHIDDELNKVISECRDLFTEYYCDLVKFNTMFEARKYVVRLGERFSITGFVVENDVEAVKKAFSDMKNVEVEDRPAHSDKRLTPPTKLKNGWLTRPFSFFVEMYGMPSYDEFDPTPLVAISYMLLFGIMFGDVGQGIVLMLVGYFFARRGMKLGEIGVRIGLSSTIFGFFYGSVFGFEELLNPLYKTVFHMHEKPIDVMSSSFTMQLLIGTIAIGITLIILCMVINIINRLKKHDYIEGLCSQNGLAGLVLYGSAIFAVIAMMVLKINVLNPFYIIICFVLPLIVIFLKEAIASKIATGIMFPEKFGGYFTEAFFEVFEIILTFLANTMSFLRVGGFVLSHAGMMLVVMTLAEMVGPAFGWLVIILGNIFVMCLEGMIVGIQVLRLEFYEMFSRYFEGNGVGFKPTFQEV